MGLACEVLGVIWVPIIDQDQEVYEIQTDNGSTAELLPELKAALGLTDPTIQELITMNDVDGKTFSEIADWLKQQWN